MDWDLVRDYLGNTYQFNIRKTCIMTVVMEMKDKLQWHLGGGTIRLNELLEPRGTSREKKQRRRKVIMYVEEL